MKCIYNDAEENEEPGLMTAIKNLIRDTGGLIRLISLDLANEQGIEDLLAEIDSSI